MVSLCDHDVHAHVAGQGQWQAFGVFFNYPGGGVSSWTCLGLKRILTVHQIRDVGEYRLVSRLRDLHLTKNTRSTRPRWVRDEFLHKGGGGELGACHVMYLSLRPGFIHQKAYLS